MDQKGKAGYWDKLHSTKLGKKVPQKMWKEKNEDKLGGGLVKWIKRSVET